MFSPQQVLDYIKTRGGNVELRDLNHFGNSLIKRLEAARCIEITGRVGELKVSLICSNFDSKQQKNIEPTETIVQPTKHPEKAKLKKPKTPYRRLKPKKEKAPGIKTKCKLLRESILNEIKKSNKPMSTEDIRTALTLNMSAKKVYYHLKSLEKQNLITSFDWHIIFWVSIEKKDLLNKAPAMYVPRDRNKALVLEVLKTADKALSVKDVVALLFFKLSAYTVRRILSILIQDGIAQSNVVPSNKEFYYACRDNTKAIISLQKLKKTKFSPLN
jgi:Fe2+ or Zn2+ uptake regulation protein